MKATSAYHSDPEILNGATVFVGTRVPVQSLFNHLEAGDSIDEFLKGFPSVKREQVISPARRIETPNPATRLIENSPR